MRAAAIVVGLIFAACYFGTLLVLVWLKRHYKTRTNRIADETTPWEEL